MTSLLHAGEENALGAFNPNINIKNDNRIRTERIIKVACEDDLLNQTNRVYEVKCQPTPDPIDLGRAVLQIKGRVVVMNGDTEVKLSTLTEGASKYILFYSGWIYSAFSKAALVFENTEIETIRDLQATMEMKKLMYLPHQALVEGQYINQCAWDHDVGDVKEEDKVCGQYSKYNMTHCVNADGTFLFEIPLSFMFETIKSLPAIYKKIFPKITLDRTNTECVGIYSPMNTTDYVANTSGKFQMKLSNINLIYPTYQFSDPTYERMVDEQYTKNALIIYHKKFESQEIRYKESVFKTRLQLAPSKHGNNALILAWYSPTISPLERSKTNASYFQLPLNIQSIDIRYGPITVFNFNNLNDKYIADYVVKDEIGNDVCTQNLCITSKRLYMEYIKNLTKFYSCEDMAISYEQFIKTNPFIVVDMSNFRLTEDAARMIDLAVIHSGNAGNYCMMAWLMTNSITVYNPINMSVSVTGGQ